MPDNYGRMTKSESVKYPAARLTWKPFCWKCGVTMTSAASTLCRKHGGSGVPAEEKDHA